MKYRDSGMPDDTVWGDFFNPKLTLELLGLSKNIENFIDIGTGYGTFLIPASKIISGTAVGIDIDKNYLEICKKQVDKNLINNINLIEGDISKEETLLKVYNIIPNVDYISLFNILHCEEPIELLRNASKNLTCGGKISVIHWIQKETPKGPPLNIRPNPETIIEWAKEVGLKFKKQVDLPPYHFGLLFEK